VVGTNEIAQILYERVAEDERLRGDLPDRAYDALLRWCALRASALSKSGAEDRLGEIGDELRASIRLLVSAATSGKPEPLAALPPSVVPPRARLRAEAALSASAPHPAARAAALSEALSRFAP
jgi:hypothetical protein